MDKQQIYEMAYSNKPMPREADLLDCGLYYRLRVLFDNYSKGIMPQTVCASVKADLFNEYEEKRLFERIERQTAERGVKISALLKQAVDDGCTHAAAIQDAFCGIIRSNDETLR